MKMKKALALVLALALAFALALPSFAVDIGGQTVANLPDKPGAGNNVDLTNHTFEAYQIFDATYATEEGGAESDTELVAIKWGNGIDASSFLTDLAENFSDESIRTRFAAIDFVENSADAVINQSAYKVAQIVSSFGTDDDTALAREFAAIADKHLTGTPYTVGQDMPAGYYLVVDITDVDGTQSARNLSTLSLSKDNPFNPNSKVDVPQLDKKALEVNDSTGDVDWKDNADFDIGDTVPFALTGTLPSNYDTYTTYKYVFHDTLSDGLTLNADSFQVYIDSVLVTEGYVIDTNPPDGESFTVTFADLKANTSISATSVIQVLYTAQLNERAEIGGEGNPNNAKLEFSNNPGSDGDTGTTPDDISTIFTFTLQFDKLDENQEDLPGAGFTLYKEYADGMTPPADAEQLEGTNYYKVKEMTGTTNFEFSGLDAGNYMLEETTVPNGYNKAENMYFTVEAEYNIDTKPATVKTLSVAKVTDKDGNELAGADGQPSIKMTGDTTSGIISTDIINLSGVTLPSTGGIGTTIFYIVGGLLIAGAGIILIAKKRMS